MEHAVAPEVVEAADERVPDAHERLARHRHVALERSAVHILGARVHRAAVRERAVVLDDVRTAALRPQRTPQRIQYSSLQRSAFASIDTLKTVQYSTCCRIANSDIMRLCAPLSRSAGSSGRIFTAINRLAARSKYLGERVRMGNPLKIIVSMRNRQL